MATQRQLESAMIVEINYKNKTKFKLKDLMEWSTSKEYLEKRLETGEKMYHCETYGVWCAIKLTTATPEILQSMLSLIGYEVGTAKISSWGEDVKEDVEKYCAKVHLKASDNNVRIPKKPKELEKYKAWGK